MNRPPYLRGGAARLLFGLTAALCLVGSSMAGPLQTSAERKTAEKVAKKVERAKSRAANQAKEEQEAVRHFQKEVARYVRIHENQLARLGGQKGVTGQGLAAAIAADRAKAKQGDVFLPEIQPLLRRLIAEQLKGPDTLAARKAVVEGNPDDEKESVPVEPHVNAAYPSGATRSTVPPSVLLTLPPLPECLHYRFVGRDLILIDSIAQIIVDFLPNATPAVGVK